VALAFCRVLTNASGSYTWPIVMPCARFDGLNGLKLQVHSAPCSLERVSVPLGPDDFPEEDGELVPHAAASRPAAMRTPSIFRRLMAQPFARE
jgi:hypothetical protein